MTEKRKKKERKKKQGITSNGGQKVGKNYEKSSERNCDVTLNSTVFIIPTFLLMIEIG